MGKCEICNHNFIENPCDYCFNDDNFKPIEKNKHPEESLDMAIKLNRMDKENKELKEQLERATKRLSLPIKKIRGDGFIELMAELRKIK